MLFPLTLSSEKGNYSLSLSLSELYIYSFLQLFFRLMNHCIFFITLFWVNTIWWCVFLSSRSQVFSLSLSLSYSFCLIFFFLTILSYFGCGNLNLYQNTILYLNVPVNYLSNRKCTFVMSFDYHCHTPNPIPGFVTMTGMLISSLNLILTRTNLTFNKTFMKAFLFL